MAPFSDDPDMDLPMESDGSREPEPQLGCSFLTLVWFFLAAAVISNIFAWALGF